MSPWSVCTYHRRIEWQPRATQRRTRRRRQTECLRGRSLTYGLRSRRDRVELRTRDYCLPVDVRGDVTPVAALVDGVLVNCWSVGRSRHWTAPPQWIRNGRYGRRNAAPLSPRDVNTAHPAVDAGSRLEAVAVGACTPRWLHRRRTAHTHPNPNTDTNPRTHKSRYLWKTDPIAGTLRTGRSRRDLPTDQKVLQAVQDELCRVPTLRRESFDFLLVLAPQRTQRPTFHRLPRLPHQHLLIRRIPTRFRNHFRTRRRIRRRSLRLAPLLRNLQSPKTLLGPRYRPQEKQEIPTLLSKNHWKVTDNATITFRERNLHSRTVVLISDTPNVIDSINPSSTQHGKTPLGLPPPGRQPPARHVSRCAVHTCCFRR